MPPLARRIRGWGLLAALVVALGAAFGAARDICAAAPAATDPLLGGVHVTVVDAGPAETPRWEKLARDLSGLTPGRPLSAPALEAALDALRQSRRFAAIHADTRERGARMELYLRVTPRRLIRRIDIRGAWPLFEREVRRVMTVAAGMPVLPDQVAGQAEPIRELYRAQGFVDPRVTVSAAATPAESDPEVRVLIRPGAVWRLGALRIEGAAAVSDERLRLLSKTWRRHLLPGRAGRFVAADVTRDVTAITQVYRRRGFYDAVVAPEIRREPGAHTVDVTLRIEEGLRYSTEFTGNRHFSNRVLAKMLVLADEGNRDGRGVRRSVRRIRERYREAGFERAEVHAADTPPAEGVAERTVRFVIEEGLRSVVAGVRVTGNRAIATGTIMDRMLTRPPGLRDAGAFVAEVLERDLDAIRTLYRQEGFLDARVAASVDRDAPDDGTDEDSEHAATRTVTVAVDVTEGDRTRVGDVTVDGLAGTSADQAFDALALTPGEPLRPYMLTSDRNALSALVAAEGYPHVTVEAAAGPPDDRGRAGVIYAVTPGPRVRIGTVDVRGNRRTRPGILQREARLAPGDPFSLAAVADAQRRLRDMAIFDSVHVRALGLAERRETVHLMVDLVEKAPYYLEAGTGYDSAKGMFVNATTGDHNLLGAYTDGWVGGEVSEIGHRLETGATMHRVLGTPLEASASLFDERLEEFNQDFGSTARGVSASLGRPPWRHLVPSVSLRVEQREQFSRQGPSAGEVFEARTVAVLTPALRYDRRDSFVRPRHGFVTSLAVDLSSGLENDLDDFIAVRFDQRVFTSPWPRLTLAAVARAAHIEPYGAAGAVPDDQLLFLGGTTDVRGFDENALLVDAAGEPAGGRSALSAGIEGRLAVGRNVELTLFGDIGRVFNPAQAGLDSDARASVGAGLRYLTPIGPVGLLYGHKLDRRDGEAAGRWHFSIGYSF